MAVQQREDQARLATKMTLASIFMGLLGAFSAWLSRRGEDVKLEPLDVLLIGLSTYRAGRLVAYERVGEPIRAPFTQVIPDASGAGETVVAHGRGVRWVFGELFSCPICVGTWVAAFQVYGLHLAPRPTRVFIAVMGTTGVAQVFNELTEALSWGGRSARKSAGSD